ncbi:biotin transporter BioY [Risungbinella massiliensis]|uniref:biotin transporter BioY n=1 Tax=Risungbinella massiliensis TaxID=1329796 RepID=UPI0005CC35FD|nr:biotin transporter BioY [Risungbinella massiliensis]
MSYSFNRLRNMSLAALFAALLAIGGMISIPIQPPITLQTLVVMLAGSLLGPIWGMVSMFLFIALVAAGLPLLAGGSGGIAPLFGPTAGYIWSWPLAVLIIGFLIQKWGGIERKWVFFAANFIGGFLFVHALGLPWFVQFTNLPWEKSFLLVLLPYVPGDIGKVILSSLLAITLTKALPSKTLPINQRIKPTA